MLVFGRLKAVGFGEAGGDLFVGRLLRYFAFAIAAAERDLHAANVDRLVCFEGFMRNWAMYLFQLAGQHHLLSSFGGEFFGVFFEGLGAITAAEVNFASFKLHAFAGFAGLARNGALGVFGLADFGQQIATDTEANGKCGN